MRRYLAQGLSQQKIANQWEQDSGNKVSRAAIGLAIARYGLSSAHERPRHEDLIPWSVRTEHNSHKDLRCLRLEARRRKGLPISERERQWLTGWLAALQDADAVVAYEPNTEQGFWWVARRPEDGDGLVRQPK